MRKSTVALGTLLLGLVAVPTASFAGWADRVSGNDSVVVPAERLSSAPSLNAGYRLPTRAEKVQGMAPYQAFSNSPYANETSRPAPAPVIDTPANDPVYFNQAMGTNRY